MSRVNIFSIILYKINISKYIYLIWRIKIKFFVNLFLILEKLFQFSRHIFLLYYSCNIEKRDV